MAAHQWFNRGKRSAFLAAAAAAALGVSACGGTATDDTTDSSAAAGGSAAVEGKEKKPLRIAYLGPKANTYSEATHKGLVEAAKESGSKVTFVDSTFDAAKQYAALQAIVSAGKYDAVVLIAMDSAGLVPAAKQAIEAGLIVVSTDNPLGPDFEKQETQVAGQAGAVLLTVKNRGTRLGEATVKACKGVDPCNVGWIQATSGSSWDEAVWGFAEDVIKQQPSIKVVSNQGGGNFLASGGLKVAQDMLQAHPDLNVLVTSSDQMTSGAELAVKKANRAGKVKLIGHGGGCPGAEAVKDGRWFAGVPSLPESEGRIAGEVVMEAWTSGERGISLDPVAETKSPEILLSDNVDGFKCEWKG